MKTNDQKLSLAFDLSEIVQVRYLLERKEIRDKISDYLFMFFCCECIYKIVFDRYDKAHENKSDGKPSLNMSEIKSVLEWYGIKYNLDLINKLFGSNDDSYAACSIKKFRDRLVHRILKKAIETLLERNSRDLLIMKSFIDMLEDYVNEKDGL